MEVSMAQYPPGDLRLVDKIVCQLKSQGIFDRFRKECIADVDTKPAYQNLHQRVESSVSAFLSKQEWKSDLNKNQVRDSLRKHIHESGFLDIGVERIVDQVVNPKIMPVFLPQIEDVVYSCLGIEKPKRNKENTNVTLCLPSVKKPPEKKPEPLQVLKELLPKDLDPVSPESDCLQDDDMDNVEDHDNKIADEEESSPPFEPIAGIHSNSNDSHLSDISGLTSQDSQISDISFSVGKEEKLVNKERILDLCSQDSQLSKVSSGSRISVEFSEEQDIKSKEETDQKNELFSRTSQDFSNHSSSPSEFRVTTDPSQDHLQQSNDLVRIAEKYQERNCSNELKNNYDSAISAGTKYAESANVETNELSKIGADENNLSFDGTDINEDKATVPEACALSNCYTVLDRDTTYKNNSIVKTENIQFESGEKVTRSSEMDDEGSLQGETTKFREQTEQEEKEGRLAKENDILLTCEEIKYDSFSDKAVSTCKTDEKSIIGTTEDLAANVMATRSEMTRNEELCTKSFGIKSEERPHLDELDEQTSVKSTEDNIVKQESEEKQSVDNSESQGIFSYEDTSETCSGDVLIENKQQNDIKISKEQMEGNLEETFDNNGFKVEKNDIVSVPKETGEDIQKDMSKKESHKEHNKDLLRTEKHVKNGSKDRTKFEKEPSKDRSRHEKISKDISKDRTKHDDKKGKDGSKERSRRDESKDRSKRGDTRDHSKREGSKDSSRNDEGKDRTKREDKSDKEATKDKNRHDDKIDKDRSRHDSKSEKGRDNSRDEKGDKGLNKDRKEEIKEKLKRENGKEKEDKGGKSASKDKTKQEDKADRYKVKTNEKSKMEKDKLKSENSSTKSSDSEEKLKTESKRNKEKSKHGKPKHDSDSKNSEGKDGKSNDDKDKTMKHDHKERSKERLKNDSVDNGDKKGKERNKSDGKIDKERKSHEKVRDASSRKTDKKTDSLKSSKSGDNKSKDKRKDNKDKASVDDHHLHRDKNSEDRRSTDRDSNGTSCDKSRSSGADSQSSHKREKRSNSQGGNGKSDGGGGASESSGSNTKSDECNEDDKLQLSSHSSDSSPTNSLPFKKRPHQHSETEDWLDEYSCTSNSGRLLLKLKKPKIASNIFEVKKIMQLRKSMAKMERVYKNRLHNGKRKGINTKSDPKNITNDEGKVGNLRKVGTFKTDPNWEGGYALSSVVVPTDTPEKKCDIVSNSVEKDLLSQQPVVLLEKVNYGSGYVSQNESYNEDDGDLRYFETDNSESVSELAAFIKTYEENIHSDAKCISDCSDNESETSEITHTLSHLKHKVVQDIVNQYIRQNHGIGFGLSVSTILPASDTSVLKSDGIHSIEVRSNTDYTKEVAESIELKDKVITNAVGEVIPLSSSDTSVKRSTLITRSKRSGHYEKEQSVNTRKLSSESFTSSTEKRHSELYTSLTGKKLPKGYALEIVPMENATVEGDNAYEKEQKGNIKIEEKHSRFKNSENLNRKLSPSYKMENPSKESCGTTIDASADQNYGRVESIVISGNKVEERQNIVEPKEQKTVTPHSSLMFETTQSLKTASSNGTENIFVVADSDEDDIQERYQCPDNNNVDKSSSDDEKMPALSTDLIFPALRDLMLESGMQKKLLPEQVAGVNIQPKSLPEPKRALLGRSRRPGLSRPSSGSGTGISNNNSSRTSTPDFVMPLSPESDVSASSGEQAKKIADHKGAESVDDQNFGVQNVNEEGAESRRSLRSAATPFRGQRYNCDELYKPRPLFYTTSRRTKTKQTSPPPAEEMTFKRRSSTVEGSEPSHPVKRAYR